MKNNKLYSHVFYNLLIEPLNKIKLNVEAGDYTTALLSAFNMANNLNITDWHPFPSYQRLSTRFLLEYFARLLKNEIATILNIKKDKKTTSEEGKKEVAVSEEDKKKVLTIIFVLESRAHLLNLLETTYSDPEKTKAKILYNTGKTLGLFRDTPKQTYDCHANLQFSSQKTVKQPDLPATETYISLVSILESLNDDRLQTITTLLFLNMETIEKDSAIDKKIKSSEKNIFALGRIEWMIDCSNAYKLEFKTLLEQPNQSDDSEDTTTYDFLNHVLSSRIPH